MIAHEKRVQQGIAKIFPLPIFLFCPDEQPLSPRYTTGLVNLHYWVSCQVLRECDKMKREETLIPERSHQKESLCHALLPNPCVF
jgi:hypothetical protein